MLSLKIQHQLVKTNICLNMANKISFKISKDKKIYAGTFIEQANSKTPAIKKDASVCFTEFIEQEGVNPKIKNDGTIYCEEFIEQADFPKSV